MRTRPNATDCPSYLRNTFRAVGPAEIAQSYLRRKNSQVKKGLRSFRQDRNRVPTQLSPYRLSLRRYCQRIRRASTESGARCHNPIGEQEPHREVQSEPGERMVIERGGAVQTKLQRLVDRTQIGAERGEAPLHGLNRSGDRISGHGHSQLTSTSSSSWLDSSNSPCSNPFPKQVESTDALLVRRLTGRPYLDSPRLHPGRRPTWMLRE